MLYFNYNGEVVETKEKALLNKENQKLDKNLVNDTDNHYKKLKDKDSNKINFNGVSEKTITTLMDGNAMENAKKNTYQDKEIWMKE